MVYVVYCGDQVPLLTYLVRIQLRITSFICQHGFPALDLEKINNLWWGLSEPGPPLV